MEITILVYGNVKISYFKISTILWIFYGLIIVDFLLFPFGFI